MSERRPHWDDDLTDAVFRALSHTYRAQGWTGGIAIDLDESVYPLIAAVEDWQVEQAAPGVSVAELLSAWAAIARVREWCELRYIPLDLTDWQQGFLNARDEVQAILDGGDA